MFLKLGTLVPKLITLPFEPPLLETVIKWPNMPIGKSLKSTNSSSKPLTLQKQLVLNIIARLCKYWLHFRCHWNLSGNRAMVIWHIQTSDISHSTSRAWSRSRSETFLCPTSIRWRRTGTRTRPSGSTRASSKFRTGRFRDCRSLPWDRLVLL